MIEQILAIVERLSNLPLPVFILFGSFLEEIVTPIPASAILTVGGTLIPASMKLKFLYVIFLSFLSGIGKTAGSYLLYLLAAKVEFVVIDKFGKFFGVKRADVEKISKKFNKGKKDDWAIFLLRAMPMIPTAPVSLVCGLLKINKRSYIVSTFWGTFVRTIMYLNLGIFGLKALKVFGQEPMDVEMILAVIGIVAIVAVITFLLLRKKLKKKL